MDPNNPYQPQQPPQTPAPAPQPQPGSYYTPVTPPQPTVPQPQSYTPPQNNWPQPQQPQTFSPQSSLVPLETNPSYTPPPRPQRYDKLPLPVRIAEWLKSHWWAPLTAIFALLVIGDIIYQLLFPLNALPPGTKVDGVTLSNVDRDKAAALLDTAYGNAKVNLYFGDATVPYRTPTAKEVGIQVDNTQRLANVGYPFALRFVPTSLWWASSFNSAGTPTYNYTKTTLDTYALKNLGEDCRIEPQNATLKLDDGRFTVVSAVPGGKCNITEFKDGVGKATVKDGAITVRTGIKQTPAKLTDDIARQLADELNHNLEKDMPLQAGGETSNVPNVTVKGWLTFKAIIPDENQDGTQSAPPRLTYVIDPDRVRTYLDKTVAEKVEQKPGVTKISTTDFTENSRTEGAPGVLIDLTKTIANIDAVVAARATSAAVVTGPVPATLQYTRKYTPSAAGYSSLIQQFAQDNPGKIGIVFQELTGKKPILGGVVNDTLQLPASGIEGAYLAYAAQMGIEDGSIQQTDRINGSRSVNDCIAAAVSDQDKDCIAALLGKIGNSQVQARMQQAGLTGTSFGGATTVTTARDVSTFITKEEANQLGLKSKEKLQSAMRDLSMRDGILKVTTGNATDIIGGDNDGGYHQGAIISKDGKYSIAVVTQDSNAETVEKLIKAVEAIRAQKQALKSGQ